MYSGQLTALTDEHLILLLKDSNQAAFTELYNRYWKKMFIVAANKLSHTAEAEEVVQDIFLDLWNRRHDIQINSKPATYLAAAVKYRVINVLAKEWRKEKFKSQFLKTVSEDDDALNHWLSFEDLKKRLEKLVAELPEKCQLVYKLSREEGYTHKEISAALSISEKTVESHLTKALGTIRKKLDLFFISLFL